MKKFLTVLLALSVVFTYTVGTAFAGTVAVAADKPSHEEMVEFSKDVDTVAGDIKADFERNYDKAVKALFNADFDGATVAGNEVSKAACEKGAEAFKGAYLDAVDAVAKAAKEAYGVDKEAVPNVEAYILAGVKAKGLGQDVAYTVGTITSVINWFFTTTTITDAANLVQVAVLTVAFDEAKADVIDVLSNFMDLSMYSTKVQKIEVATDDVRETSYRALAEEYVDELIATANGTYLDSLDKTVTLVDGKIDIIDGIAAHYAPIAGSFQYKLVDTPDYLITSETEEDETVANELAKADALAKMEAEIATYLKSVAKENLATAKKNVEAYRESQTYRINNTEGNVVDAPAAITAPNLSVYISNVNAMKALEDYAAKYALEKDANGNVLRDAEKVADVVTAAKDKAFAYNGGVATWTKADTAAAEKAIRENCYVAEAKTEYEVNVRKALIEAEREDVLYNADGTDKYYAPEAEKVNALFDALLAKIDAAKDNAAVKKVPVRPTAAELSLIHTKAQVISLIKATSNFKADKKDIDREEALVNFGLNPYDDAYVDFANYNATDYEFFADLYAENGVRANADITDATFELAKAAIGSAKSNDTLAAEKAAVEALIAVIPSRVTEADRAAVEAAAKAYSDYHDNIADVVEVKNINDLRNAINIFYTVDKAAVNALSDKLPAFNLLTLADKAAVKEYCDAVEKFLELTEDGGIYENVNDTTPIKDTKATLYFNAIRALDKAAVIDMIGKLPLNITVADKAAVEAAREAYDAFITEYTDYEEPYDAASQIGNFRELALAEAAIEAAENAAAIASVEGLKIKASSSAVKGKITVKWTVKGDVPAGTVYKVYKSTKAQSGYAYMGKTTKNYMANKKNLKKGKRYFYKVKAVLVVDGQTYTSDWSNKANRFAK